MSRRRAHLVAADDAAIRSRFDAARSDLGITVDFPPAVLAEAEVSSVGVAWPAPDRTDLPLVTLDPPTSTDLDQAFALERRGSGFRVHYAIADVGAFVRPGGLVDAEAHRRVETAYSPDTRALLHPPVISESGASLLPGGPRPAVLWTVDVDGAGLTTDVQVQRAVVASRAKLGYPQVQRALDRGTADDMLALLPQVGALLMSAERARGGMSLKSPSQEVVQVDRGFRLEYRAPLPCEEFNAQLSLLTGRAAATLMIQGGVGILRTMPPADERDVVRLRRVAAGLDIEWAARESYAQLLHRLDARHSPQEAAFLQEATVLFRGAGYVTFDGAPPAADTHAAIAAPYTHATAPLRRLVDRYVSEICLSLQAGAPVPEWVLADLPRLPEVMAAGAARGNALDRRNLDLVEAAVLAPAVGRVFDAIVVDVRRDGRVEVALRRPAVVARFVPADGTVLTPAARVRVRLEAVDVDAPRVEFSLVTPSDARERRDAS